MSSRYVPLEECVRIVKIGYDKMKKAEANSYEIHRFAERFMEPILSELGLPRYDQWYQLIRYLYEQRDAKKRVRYGGICEWLADAACNEVSNIVVNYEVDSLIGNNEIIDMMKCLRGILENVYIRREINVCSFGDPYFEEMDIKKQLFGRYKVPEWKLKKVSKLMAELAAFAGDEDLSGEFRSGKRYGDSHQEQLYQPFDFKASKNSDIL